MLFKCSNNSKATTDNRITVLQIWSMAFERHGCWAGSDTLLLVDYVLNVHSKCRMQNSLKSQDNLTSDASLVTALCLICLLEISQTN